MAKSRSSERFTGVAARNLTYSFVCWVKGTRPDRVEFIRVVGVQEQRIEQNAHQALVAAMRAHRRPDFLFEFLVGFGEIGVHLNREHALVVARQVVRNVFEREEGGRVHQKLAEQQRRCSGLPQNLNRLLRRPRAGVIFLAHLLDGFEHSVLLLKVAPSLAAVGEAFACHRVRFHTVEDVEEIVGVAAHQRAGERDQLAGCASQHSEAIALCRVASQLVQFVRDGEVEPAPHIAAHELDRRHALNAIPIRLPQSGVPRRSALRQSQRLRELELVAEVEIGQLLPLRIENR